MEKEEYDTLREAWIKWNKTCHPEDQIDWIEFSEEATNKYNENKRLNMEYESFNDAPYGEDLES
jgi:hypothetical protein